MISYVKEALCMPLNVLKGNYLKMVKDTENMTTRYREASRRGFQII